jgi:hypothetical protein
LIYTGRVSFDWSTMAAMSYIQRSKQVSTNFAKGSPGHWRANLPRSTCGSASATSSTPSRDALRRNTFRSLRVKDVKGAKRRAHPVAAWFIDLTDDAVMALLSPAPSTPAAAIVIDPEEIGEAVYHDLMAGDETVRIEGDDRRHLQDPHERANRWPDLEAVRPPLLSGMEVDRAEVYGGELSDLAREYREAYAIVPCRSSKA